MVENPYEAPSDPPGIPESAVALPVPRRATEVFVLLAAFLLAAAAVPLLYRVRSPALWSASIALFAGAPALVGRRHGRPTAMATSSVLLLLLACPPIYLFADPRPLPWEQFRDAAFLATGSHLAFVAAAWSGHCGRTRRRAGLAASLLLLVAAAGSVGLMVTLFMYLE